MDDWTDRRRRIVQAKDRGDTRYLTEALRDPDHRALAAKYVGDLGIAEASDPLLRLLEATDPHVRAAAATALGQLGSKAALPRLRDVALHDEEPFVRSWAVGALGEIRDFEDLDLLVRLLRDPSLRVRGGAAFALERLGDARALEPLRAARRRLRRSPVEWWWHRKIYNAAISRLVARSRGPIDAQMVLRTIRQAVEALPDAAYELNEGRSRSNRFEWSVSLRPTIRSDAAAELRVCGTDGDHALDVFIGKATHLEIGHERHEDLASVLANIAALVRVAINGRLREKVWIAGGDVVKSRTVLFVGGETWKASARHPNSSGQRAKPGEIQYQPYWREDAER